MNWMVVTLGSVLVLGAAVALLVTVGPLSHFASGSHTGLGGIDPHWPFSGKVQTIGQRQFPQIFAGATLHSDGSLTIYCTQVTSALKTFVAKADTDGAKYTFVIVPRSFATLEQTTLAIAHDGHILRSKGVALNHWGPDPAHGQVNVRLTEPSASQMQDLASALQVPASSITLTTYPGAVQTLLQRRFGNFVVVSSTYHPPSRFFSRSLQHQPRSLGSAQIPRVSNEVGVEGHFTHFLTEQ